MAVRARFQDIVLAWHTDVPTRDLYNMIVEWIETFKAEIHNQSSVEEILDRMTWDDHHDIVDDVVYGKRYEALRAELV